MLGETFLIAWSGYGVKIEKELETDEAFIIYISVPETSEFRNANNVMMAGTHLAKRIKETLTDVGIKRLTVKYKIRKGENWTKEKRAQSELEMRKQLFGSQY